VNRNNVTGTYLIMLVCRLLLTITHDDGPLFGSGLLGSIVKADFKTSAYEYNC